MKLKMMLVLVLVFLCASGAAVAQQSNADYYNEQKNIQQQQWQQEQNRLGYQAAQNAAAAQQIPTPPPRPSGEWINTWGAVADGNNGRGGVAVGQMSKSAAENEAVNQCARGGGANCKPTLAYENQCVVIASGQTSNLVQSAGSIDRAKDLAVPECSKRNNGSICEIVYSACSDPIFRSY